MWQSPGERIKQKQRELAAKGIPLNVKQDDTEKPALPSLAHYQTALSVDLAKISALKTMAERTETKRKLLPTYLDFVMDYMAQKHNYPNDVAVQIMVWLFDVGDIDTALKLAFYLMPHQVMPSRFTRRDIQTFVCDAIYDWAKTQLDNGNSALPLIDSVVALLDGWQLSPPVHSKVLVIAAKHHNNAGNFKTVVEYCEKAKKVNPEGWGAKTLLATAKQRL